MSKNHVDTLQNPENWNFEHSEARPPVKSPRVVVSVAFRREDFEIVSSYAEHMDKKTSEFIREAALEKATGKWSQTIAVTFASIGSLWFTEQLPNSTRVNSSPQLQGPFADVVSAV